jgi:hypothetical protein
MRVLASCRATCAADSLASASCKWGTGRGDGESQVLKVFEVCWRPAGPPVLLTAWQLLPASRIQAGYMQRQRWKSGMELYELCWRPAGPPVLLTAWRVLSASKVQAEGAVQVRCGAI